MSNMSTHHSDDLEIIASKYGGNGNNNENNDNDGNMIGVNKDNVI